MAAALARARTAVKRTGRRGLRAALRRLARTRPPRRAGDPDRVSILLLHAWGMGGTIRAAHALAEHLATSRPVELLSVVRLTDEPFFPLPPGVAVRALDDRRPDATPALLRPVRAVLSRLPSVLSGPAGNEASMLTAWTDLTLARTLRGLSGTLVTTRPPLALLALDLAPDHVKVVAQEHMNLRSHPQRVRRMIRARYGGLDALVVLTDTDARRYAELLGPSAPPIVTIPNVATPLGGPPYDPTAPTILAAGRLRAQKGFDLLIEAFAIASEDRPEWRLRICGRGRLRKELTRLAAEQGVKGRVRFAGPSRDLGEDMAHASIYALSSRFEGFPVVLLEAMAKGMAVVSFDCPTGPADVIDDGRNGLLVPPRDVEAFAAALGRLMDDVELRRDLGRAAARSTDAYTTEAVGALWDALFDDLDASCAATDEFRRLARFDAASVATSRRGSGRTCRP